MRIAIIGAPGSGKTTQSQLLAKSLNVPVISIGEELREIAYGKGNDAKVVREALAKGDLVLGEVVLSLLRRHLSDPQTQRGFILDGMPRTAREAQEVLQLFAFDRVFHLKVDSSTALERLLKRRREDDNPEVIAHRFEVYEQEEKAILELYRNLGILVEVDASNPSVTAVQREIIANLR